MKHRTLAYLLGTIVVIFILQLWHATASNAISENQSLTLLGVLLFVIVHPFFIPKKKKNRQEIIDSYRSKQEAIARLKKIKQKYDREKYSI